jgi:hypothetical protein
MKKNITDTGVNAQIVTNKWSYVELSFIKDIAVSSAKLKIELTENVSAYIDGISLSADYLLGAETSLVSKFSKGPRESVLYSNGYSNYIWPGMEFEPAVVFTAANEC